MAKKYYWLKLKDDFFRSKEIKKLRKISGGDTFTIIYLKMQLLSIKQGGIIEYDGTEDDLAEQLALELDESLEDVKLTLAFMGANKLIEQVTEETYILNKVPELIGSETDAAERMRKMRNNVTPKLPDVTQRKEIDIEIDIDKQKEYIGILRSSFPGSKTKAQAMKKLPKLLKTYGFEQMKRTVERYIKSVEDQRKNGFKDLKYMNESTFWNGRYMDFLDDSYFETQDYKSDSYKFEGVQYE